MNDVKWKMHGGITEHGQIGGDVQLGRSFGIRFVHTSLPGRVVEVVAYPVTVDVAGQPHEEGEFIELRCEQQMTVCRDVEDPGSTEVWSDIEFVELPERFTRTYARLRFAELEAQALVAGILPEHIGWDGSPNVSLDRHQHTLHDHSSMMDDPVGAARRMVEHNHERGAALDWECKVVPAEDGSRTLVAWVFDTQDMVDPEPDNPWSGPPAGGEVVVCWWEPIAECAACDSERYVTVYCQITDAVLGTKPCPVCR